MFCKARLQSLRLPNSLNLKHLYVLCSSIALLASQTTMKSYLSSTN